MRACTLPCTSKSSGIFTATPVSCAHSCTHTLLSEQKKMRLRACYKDITPYLAIRTSIQNFFVGGHSESSHDHTHPSHAPGRPP